MSTARCQSVDLSTSKCAICEEKYKFDDKKCVSMETTLCSYTSSGNCLHYDLQISFRTSNEGVLKTAIRGEPSCSNCVGNVSTCAKCNVKGGYYQYVEFTTIKDKKCVINTTLDNCEWVSEYGCAVCLDGYYQNKYLKCPKCVKLRATCSDNNTCSLCINQYVLISKYNKFGPNGDECVHTTNVLSIILPIIFDFLKKSPVNEFLLKDLKKKEVDTIYIGTQKTHFEGEIAVQKDGECKFMIGNDRTSLLKIQFTTQNDKEKFELNVKPSIPVSIEKGCAVELTVAVYPLCTLEKTIDITCSVLNINKGKISEIKIPVKFASEMSTALNPDELKKVRKLREGSFGIVFKGTYRGNVVAIKEMKEMVVAT
ncbi:hypothetical protein EIN_006100 [Entamoeba invadens IP1]|uniref:Protein serine/threonine kinase n=1 Tax=Entamoeba invadens IP1 TaxID=370355 RepID=A0A0A1UCN1_ENTIV|nr:hypothetical protein EIN_006100 [Entamoeba invadens IP1]ELP93679.1 hypothetical protein EIN_006100 [Entamoeba invadens IP1]|eukprot:XP_004260450.1 hypothetical protein EIN_006100 [Entamoeba invadens IP1]